MADVQVRFHGDGRDLDRTIQHSTEGLRGLGRAKPNVDMGPATRSVHTFGNEVQRAHSGMGKLAAAGAGLVAGWGLTHLLTSAASAGIKYNATIESQTIAFGTLLGSQKDAVALLKDIQRTAASTPFELPQLAQGMQRLLAFKFSVKDAKETLMAAGDAAAAMGGSPEIIQRVANALGQMRVKGKLSGEELLQLAEANINAYGYLRDEFNLTGADFQNLTKAQEKHGFTVDQAIRAIVKGMRRDFAGAMDAQSLTFNGLMSTLRDDTNMTLGAITKGIFDATKGWLPVINKAMGDIQAIWNQPGLSPKEKLDESWEAIRKTGLPAEAKKALLEGFAYVGENAPKALLDAFMASPGWGKVAIGGILLTKFGPGIRSLGGLMGGAAAGGAGRGILGGAVGAAAGRVAPVPVIVMNPGLGGIGGPAGGLSKAGILAGFGRGAATAAPALATPAIGAEIGLGATTGLSAGPILAAGAAAIGGLALGGIGLQKLAAGGHLGPLNALFPSDAEVKKQSDRMTSQVISAWRDAGGRVDAFVERRKRVKATGGELMIPPEALDKQREAMARGAARAVDALEATLKQRGPTVARTTEGLVGNVLKGLDGLKPAARTLAEDTMVEMAISLEKSGRLPKGTVRALVKAIKSNFGELPAATQHAVDAFIVQTQKIAPAVQAAKDALASLSQPWANDTSFEVKIRPIVPPGLRPGPPTAAGGMVPGVYRGVDTHMTPVASGEAILTPAQQGLVEGGMSVRQAIAVTGGNLNGWGFAKGGIQGALTWAQGQVGKPYGWGAGHAYGTFASYDCSGFATNAASRVPGYTGGIGGTQAIFPKSAVAKGNEPVLFGFLGMEQNDPHHQHMGIRIAGQWFESGGSTGVIHGRSRWPSGLRVPPGLEGLADNLGPGPGGQDQETTAERRAAVRRQRATTRAVSGTLGRIGTAGEAPTALSAQATTTIGGVGRTAARNVLRGGGTAGQATEAKDDAERRATRDWYEGERAKTVTRLGVVNHRIAAARAEIRTLSKKMPSKGPGRARMLQQRAAAKKRLHDLLAEKAGLRAWRQEIADALLDLDIQDKQDQEDDAEAALPKDDGTGGDGGAAETPAPTGMTQADVDAAVAEATRVDVAGRGVIFGPGDLGVGGPSALDAVMRSSPGPGVVINYSALLPGSPQAAAQIAAGVTGALGMQGNVTSPGIRVLT